MLEITTVKAAHSGQGAVVESLERAQPLSTMLHWNNM